MYPLPCLQKFVALFCHLGKRTVHHCRFYAAAPDQFHAAIRAQQVNFGLTGAGDVNMGGLVVGTVDDEAEPMGTVDDDHAEYNLSVGFLQAYWRK